MAYNKLIDRPPLQVALIDTEVNRITTTWSNWFDSLHRVLSPTRNVQLIKAAGAIDLDATQINLDTTTAGFAVTLDAPTTQGLWKNITMTVRVGSNNVTLALTNCEGGTATTTCTWNAITQSLLLYSMPTAPTTFKWCVIKQFGVTLS